MFFFRILFIFTALLTLSGTGILKKIFILFSVVFAISFSLCGQVEWTIDFEGPAVFDRIFIDTISSPNNTWQIGEPGKPLFNSSFSPTHAILTDISNPYPPNNTSSFIITHIRDWPIGTDNYFLLLDFYFKMDSDTLEDYGKIDISIDNGSSWHDLDSLDALNYLFWLEPKPVLTGAVHEWTHFSVDLAQLTFYLGYSDTLLYKFTFISDDLNTDKEGWIIDDFLFEDFWEGIDEHRNDDMISVYPVPASNYLELKRNGMDLNEAVEVLDLCGRTILSVKDYQGGLVDIGTLSGGIYLLKYRTAEKVAIKKFIVAR